MPRQVTSDWYADPAQQQRPEPLLTPLGNSGQNIEQAFATQRGNSDWRDTQNYSGDQWGAWEQEERQRVQQGTSANQQGGCPPDRPFTSRPGPDGRTQCAYKPDDCPDGSHVVGTPGTCVAGPPGSEYGAGGGGAGGAGGAGGGTGGAGGVPQFNAPRFTPPSYEEAMADPGYQFALKQGQTGIEHSAAAAGMARTGQNLSDLLKYNQGMAANQYQNVYNRAANTYGLNYQAAKDEFAPQYGGWQTQYGGDLSKWTTNQNAGLSKYLQQQQNIYGLVTQPISAPPTWA